MTVTGIPAAGPGGVLRLTWVRDQLAHVAEHCDTDEPSGTWTGLACPDHGLPLGADVDAATVRQLSTRSQIADLIWEAPADPALPGFRLVTTPTAVQRHAFDLLGVSHRLGVA